MLKSKWLLMVVVCSFLIEGCSTESSGIKKLSKKLAEINAKLVLVVPSTAIDAYPVWSKDSSQLFFNESGTWYSISINTLELETGLWRGRAVGVNKSKKYKTVVDASTLKYLSLSQPKNALRLKIKDDFLIESKQNSLGWSIYINGQKYLNSTFDVFHSFVSNNKEGHFIAFLSEKNGLLLLQR